jgi:SOS-response transcriptional repressor LexA
MNPATRKPTKKQTILHDFIREFTTAHGFSPSYREIRDRMNLRSISAVAEHINNCIELGLLKKVPGTARSLEIVNPTPTPEYVVKITTVIAELEPHPHRASDVATLRGALKILQEL